MKNILIPIFGGVIGVAICLVMTGGIDRPADATDDARTGARSGLTVYIDHGTGCQYLRAGNGMFPRLGADGRPMCGKGA